ncbi:armadillo repeat-containing protein 3 [Andrena cerasifolii]|uniref:armadillo repeat-containing protein 3 n=1 Tax=Andrena cerasifolii TaxID=2819439 RepID=UPI004038108C
MSKSKERVDREGQTKHKFDPLRLEVKYPGTAILLLQCQEQPVLLAAAAALAKYGSKAQGNLQILFDLEIVNSVIPLIEHEDLFTRRFAAKLLAEMVSIPNVHTFLLESNHYVPHFTEVLANDKDLFMQEFSSLILAEMSKDMFGAAQLLAQCPNMDFLFERLQSPDPDVKKNNIEIMYNLLQDPTGAGAIIETKVLQNEQLNLSPPFYLRHLFPRFQNFNFNLVYNLFDSPYPEIQSLAMNVVADLVSRSKDDRLQNLFRESNGLQALLKFLDNEEWQDLHAEALRILQLASNNATTVELLDDIGGIKQILKYIEDTPSSKLFVHALHALYAYGIVDHLLVTLASKVQSDLYEIICHGIGMMTLYHEAAKQLTESYCIKSILEIVVNESLEWSARQVGLFALHQLLQCDIKNCDDLLDLQGQNYLLRLMKQPGDKVPAEVLVLSVECLTIIARNQGLRTILIKGDVIDAMCASFDLTSPSMDDYKIACCNALSLLCLDEAGRAGFLKARGPSKLYNLLCDVRSIPIRNAAAQLVQLLCADPVLSNAFVSARYLNYMLNNRSTARTVPSWDTCIEALFNSHLPIKFAFTGRLSLHDVIKDGFYVLRRNACPFPVLDDIFKFQICPMEPVYVVNCTRPHSSNSEEAQEAELDRNGLERLNQGNIEDVADKGVFMSSMILHMVKDSKFGSLQCDPCLYDCIELFKCKLIAAESKETSETRPDLVNVSYVAERAKMLGKFVAQQMSGPDPLIRCVDHQLEIHLKEIKDSIETSVIPLGMLRVGSYFERALLFKVIADRIHLPAALVRGEYGKAWIEIAVPQVKLLSHNNTAQTKSPPETSFQAYAKKHTCPEFIVVRESFYSYPQKEEDASKDPAPIDTRQFVFPTKLLKPNFIVDLMNTPGDLIPIGSYSADTYCEKQLVCHKLCLH